MHLMLVSLEGARSSYCGYRHRDLRDICSLLLRLGFLINVQTLSHSHRVPIPPSLFRSLEWWTSSHHLQVGVVFPPPSPTLLLTTDASRFGWGGHFLDFRVSGCGLSSRASSISTFWSFEQSSRPCVDCLMQSVED
jgi:hypothetical protein